MKQATWQSIALAWLLFITPPLYAIPSDDEVREWTSDVLLASITVNAQELEQHSKIRTVGKYYSGQARTGMQNFFSTIIYTIIKNKSQTSPQPKGPAIITGKGYFNGIPYWQVSQSFYLPTVNKTIWFSVTVIKNQDPPLIIESLNIRIKDNQTNTN